MSLFCRLPSFRKLDVPNVEACKMRDARLLCDASASAYQSDQLLGSDYFEGFSADQRP